ncbi:MAG: type II toxin-antitoxin system RelE/ParE family toxin [Cyanobacteria bacterium]|nr:type II toxin-antitoxin system RelE/ParE family toxin [Cyanobacteriota bacterium]
MTERRVILQWTTTAKDGLKKLPKKVRAGLLQKARELSECADPKHAHKPLIGPLAGYYRITYARYRAIYSVDEDVLANGDVLVCVRIRFVAAGIRKEGDKNDIYKFAQRLLQMGIIEADVEVEEEIPAATDDVDDGNV